MQVEEKLHVLIKAAQEYTAPPIRNMCRVFEDNDKSITSTVLIGNLHHLNFAHHKEDKFDSIPAKKRDFGTLDVLLL